MSIITKEWLATDIIDDQVLTNNTFTKARNAANDGNVNILKVNASDKVEMASHFLTPSSAPSANYEVANKKYVDDTAANYILTSAKGAANGVCALDANQLVSINNLPPSVIERLVIVADQTARYALTTATVQNGDTVKQTDTGEMWFVKDDTNLDSSAGYAVYTAGTASAVPFSGITGKPTTLAGYGITDAASSTHDHSGVYEPANANIQSHISSTSNPHSVTKTQVGLANVDNVQQLPMSYLDTDNTLAANSDAKVASQKAVKAYIATAVGAITGADAEEELFTMSAQNVTDGYLDLAHVAMAGSVMVFPVNGPKQLLGTDYSISYTGGVGSKTRITLLGDMITKMVEGKKVVINYLRA